MKPRHSAETKAAALKRFEEMAMPLAVAAEFGVPYRTAWGWRQRWLMERASTKPFNAADYLDGGDPGDEAKEGGGC